MKATGSGFVACIALAACAASGDESAPETFVPPADDPAMAAPPVEDDRPVESDDPNVLPTALVRDLSISEVALFQGVKVTLAENGEPAAERGAPVVAGRAGLLRVYVSPSAGWGAKKVTAELRLVGKEALPILRDDKVITTASSDGDIDSTFNFAIEAGVLEPETTFQISLISADAEPVRGESSARFPTDGSFADLGAERGGKLKIVVVPVRYDADGSNRMPDVTPAQLERYRTTFLARYPASEVEISARAPLAWSQAIARNGSGFSQVLNAMTQLRQRDGATSDVYYYGVFTPAASMRQFCTGSCVTGLSTVVTNPSASFLRASVGLGYPGQDAANTMAHEIGHAHGRAHAPCGGAQGVDSAYPYAGGAIGVWGYDILTGAFISPTVGRDMMGYCRNEWVSDYTFGALFERIMAVNTQSGALTPESSGTARGASSLMSNVPSRRFRMATVAEDGALSWAGQVELALPPTGGTPRDVAYLAAGGEELTRRTAQFYPYDHLPGGVLVIPDEPVIWSSLRIQGLAEKLAR
jgi:hypothetical protein